MIDELMDVRSCHRFDFFQIASRPEIGAQVGKQIKILKPWHRLRPFHFNCFSNDLHDADASFLEVCRPNILPEPKANSFSGCCLFQWTKEDLSLPVWWFVWIKRKINHKKLQCSRSSDGGVCGGLCQVYGNFNLWGDEELGGTLRSVFQFGLSSSTVSAKCVYSCADVILQFFHLKMLRTSPCREL